MYSTTHRELGGREGRKGECTHCNVDLVVPMLDLDHSRVPELPSQSDVR